MTDTNEPYRAPMLDLVDEPTPDPAGVETGFSEPSRQPMLDLDETVAPVIDDTKQLLMDHREGDKRLTTVNLDATTYTESAVAFCEWRKAAGIDWTYSKLAAPHPTIEGAVVPNRNWIVRDDLAAAGNPKAWGPFTDSYGLTQLDVLDTLAGVLMREGCRIKSGLVLDEGGAVAITAQREGSDQVGPRGEQIASLFTVVDSVDGSYSLRAADHLYDVVCRNTLAHAVFGGQRTWSLRHSKNAAENVGALALQIARGGSYAERLVERLFAYDQTKVGLDKVVTFMRKLRQVEEAEISAAARKNRERLVERDVEVYRSAPAAAGGTFYGLHQWATFSSTHLLGSKAVRGDEGRLLEYTVLGNGQAWQNDVVGRIDAWWREETLDDVAIQTVSLVN